MAEKGPQAGAPESKEKKASKEKEKQHANLPQKQQAMRQLLDSLKQKDDIVASIEPTEKQNEQLYNAYSKVLEVGGDLLAKQEQVQKQHVELQRKREQELKQKEEERKKEEESKREKQRKIEEDKRKEEEKRKKEEKIAQFKRKKEDAGLRLKAFEEDVQKVIKSKPDNQSFQPLLQFIEKKRAQLQKFQQRRQEECKTLQALKSTADQLGESHAINADLPNLAKLIQDEISALYTLEEKAYEQNRQEKASKIKENHPPVPIPTDQRLYNSPNFYELEISTLHSKSLAKLSQFPPEEQQNELAKVEQLFLKLRAQQKFINQIKIFIELYQVEEEVLQRNRFDFRRYSQLLARKAHLISQKKEGEEFEKIEGEMNAMTSKLNTQEFLMPFKYPLDLLVRAKDHLITEYFEKRVKELQESVKEQQISSTKLEENLAEQLQRKTAKLQELKKTQQQFDLFLENQKQLVKKSLQKQEQKKDKPKQDITVLLTNQEQINTLYAEINNNQRTIEATQILEGRREKRAALQEEYNLLNEKFMKTPLNIEQHLKRTIGINETQQLEEEEELLKLLRQCEEIQIRRQEERPLQQSGIGRYSSIIF